MAYQLMEAAEEQGEAEQLIDWGAEPDRRRRRFVCCPSADEVDVNYYLYVED